MTTQPLRNPHLFTLAGVLGLSLGLTLGCNQPPPPGSEAGDSNDELNDDPSDSSDMGDGEPGDEPGDNTLYPLVDGASWTYRVTTISGQVLGEKGATLSEVTWNDQQAWLRSGNDEDDDDGLWSESVIIREGPLALRVHKQENGPTGIIALKDYDPGFARASERWDTVGYKEELLYVRTETDEFGQEPDSKDRGHTYEVLAIEPLVVPAGTFAAAVKVERIRTVGKSSGEVVVSWYVPGVGKIREYRPADSRVEELTQVTIPGGVNLP